ncbi:MAG: flavodoxin family protein [Clostridiales bacterium]|nr:flavodoxin family protein [Clostridiales bacterium]
MKVLGISFRTKMGNTECMVKQALMGAEEKGAQVAFLRAFDLKIDVCNSCGACDALFMRGTAPMRTCVKKTDDMDVLYEAIYDADAIVYGGAVWALGMPAQCRLLTDKLIMDRFNAMITDEERVAAGVPEDKRVDKRMFKFRYAGLISQGGARTKSWTSLGLQHLNMLCMSNMTYVVDMIDEWDMTRRINSACDEALMERCRRMGHNLVEAVLSGEEFPEYKGDNEYSCPSCHLNLMMHSGDNKVTCAHCGIEGTVEMQDGKVKFVFPEEQLERSRIRIGGHSEHEYEVRSNLDEMFAKMKREGITKEDAEHKKDRFRGYAEKNIREFSWGA